ncbi:MAG TPA: sensor domain-containing diguanylate cyclase [Planctomycetota bacterium]|nr:sensor domain-containing diguanylate cyclase [Planctomycetota bacterium]HRR82101.1 sensor domain-containing diguanylate cyclase [Planctomycetota bacterium]HRT96697.1 sensor domain-containing diguanylate cyclase [Planctomycetota bacterium]
MATPASGPAYNPEAVHDTRHARRRSSLMLFSVLALAAVAALLTTVALLMAPPDMTIGQARARGLGLIAATLAAVLLVAAFWQRYLIRAASRDSAILQRTVAALRRREASDQAEFTLMSCIGDLIEVFTRTRHLEPILHEAARVLQPTFQADALVLQLHEPETGRVALAVEQGDHQLDLGEETRRAVIEGGKSILANELSASPGFGNLAQRGYASLMVAPLGRGRRSTDRSIGLVAALGRRASAFTGHELALLTRFARHAGLLIENAQLYKRAERLAERDGLTDLYNQRHFVAMLNAEIAKGAKLSAPVALLMADLDNFKQYNDAHGHPKGDVALREVARMLAENTRQRDIVARYGGEEFVIILPATGRAGARRVAEAIRAEVERFRFPDAERPGAITITIGVAVFPDDATNAEALIQRADDALYRGKRAGKNRVTWASEPAEPLPQDAEPPTSRASSPLPPPAAQ